MNKGRSFVFLFFIALFLFFLLAPTDPDLGWQLRCGKLIWHSRNLCQQNQFSVLLPNYTWVNHHWGYQAVLYPTYHFLGLWGLSLLNALIITSAFWFFYSSIKGFRLEKTIAILLTLYLSWGVFSLGVRSQLIGLLFFNIMLWVFGKTKESDWWWFLFPAVMLVWTNTHGSFALGLLLLGFFSLAVLFLNYTQAKESKGSPSHAVIAVTTSASLSVTLLNPSGAKIYREVLRHFLGPIKLSQLVAEWVPPNPAIWWLVLLGGLGLFFYLLLSSQGKNLILAFLLPVFLLLALSARRHVPLLFLTAFFLLFNSTHFKHLTQSFRKKQAQKRQVLFVFISTAFLFAAFAYTLPQTLLANRSLESFCQISPLDYPCQAVAFLKTQKQKGAIFNRYEWGGFLIWQLPEQKIFVDGRMPAWPLSTRATENSSVSPYTVYLKTLQTQPGWQETLADYKINWILISPGTFLDLKLKNSPESFGWQEALRNSTFVLYKKAL